MRLLWAVLALVAMVGVTYWLIGDAPDGGSGTFHVVVIGPAGEIYNGTVEATDATAFSVLLAASDAGGFLVEYQGQGSSVFVTSIDGHANQGAGGWCYGVDSGAGWQRPLESAGAHALQDGSRLRWLYEPDGCSP